jgi:hypothetical protein
MTLDVHKEPQMFAPSPIHIFLQSLVDHKCDVRVFGLAARMGCHFIKNDGVLFSATGFPSTERTKFASNQGPTQACLRWIGNWLVPLLLIFRVEPRPHVPAWSSPGRVTLTRGCDIFQFD